MSISSEDLVQDLPEAEEAVRAEREATCEVCGAARRWPARSGTWALPERQGLCELCWCLLVVFRPRLPGGGCEASGKQPETAHQLVHGALGQTCRV